jgi:hypothetical protein
MIKLNKLLNKSRIAEVFAAAKRMIMAFAEGSLSEDTNLSNTFSALEQSNTKLGTAINREEAVSDLEEKDEIRDSKVRAVYYLITGYLYNPEENIRAAAEEVNKVFSRYGVEIVNDSYSEESTFIDSMLNDLAAEDLTQAIVSLAGLNKALAELRTAQDVFEQARVNYEKKAAQDVNEESATKIKPEIVSIVNNKLVPYLRGMVIMDEAKYGELTLTLAKIIDDNNEVVKKRGNRPGPDEGKEN